MAGRMINLAGNPFISVHRFDGYDYRRVVAIYFPREIGQLRRGDWLRWDARPGAAEIRHYLLLREEGIEQRPLVRLAWLVAPVPDVTVGGVTYWAADQLPPPADWWQERVALRRLNPLSFDE